MQGVETHFPQFLRSPPARGGAGRFTKMAIKAMDLHPCRLGGDNKRPRQ